MTEVAGGLLEPKRRSLTVKEMLLEVQKIKKKLRFLVEEVIILCHYVIYKSLNCHMCSVSLHHY